MQSSNVQCCNPRELIPFPQIDEVLFCFARAFLPGRERLIGFGDFFIAFRDA
jgi:hypothetical protein